MSTKTDELMRLHDDAAIAQTDWVMAGNGEMRADAARQALRYAIQEVVKDAERYRWLRGGKARTGGGPRRGRVEVFRWLDRSEGEQLKGDALDAAIDAAMKPEAT